MSATSFVYRTHTCGQLRLADVGSPVVLLGWVHRVRDLGGLTFFDLRDRHGLTQVLVRAGSQAAGPAGRVRPEYVLAVHGRVEARAPEAVNAKLSTGEIDVVVDRLEVLNEAKTPPFPINEDTAVAEETRLKYRYLDLRRPALQENLALRHRVTLAVRRYFDEQGFLEIETPILTRSTPEGARDYLVPSRVHPGEFFALPQSPQIFKQILMIAGFDRYMQIVKCFRDEDLRADRQPEFTQIDVEMSFATEELVQGVVEGAIAAMFAVAGHTVQTPFPRVSYQDAIAQYGSDKPDLRPGMPIADVTEIARGGDFELLKNAVAAGHVVRGFVAPGMGGWSEKQMKDLTPRMQAFGAPGLHWMRIAGDQANKTSGSYWKTGWRRFREAMQPPTISDGDVVCLVSGPERDVARWLGNLRLSLAKDLGLLNPEDFRFAWVTDFPLFEWNADEKRWDSMHHPFTSPKPEDVPLLGTDRTGEVRARAYDLALNGSEIAGGSIRIHRADVQRQVFSLLGISDEDARARFGFFLESLEYGTPPHGGIAFGLDRIVALLAGESSIREVMAFPKTAQATDLMAGAPSTVDERQLKELRIKLTP